MEGEDWNNIGAGVGMFSSSTGGVLGGLASYYSNKAQGKLILSQAKSQAATTAANVQKLHKHTGLQLRILEDERVTAEANTRASIAAAGIMQGSQTAQEIYRKQDEEIAREKTAVRQRAIEQTISMQLESRLNLISAEAQAKMLKSAGKASMISGIFNGVSGAASFAGMMK